MSDLSEEVIAAEEGKALDGQIADLEEARRIQSDTCMVCGAELFVLEVADDEEEWLMQCSNCKKIIQREGLLIRYREVEV